MKIESGFKNKFGETFDNIVNIDFDSANEMLNNVGNCVREKNNLLDIEQTESLGMLLYEMKNEVDKDYALKIYKDYDKDIYHRHYDDLLVSNLQQKQKDIKLTDFPIGIVSINGYVVGQIMYYYYKYKPVKEYLKSIDNIEKIKQCYLNIISIIEELIKNDIYYGDIHLNNFLINNDNTIKLIDFESQYIDFSNNELIKSMTNKLIYMLKYANKNIKFNIPYDSKIDDVKKKVMSLKLK